jgi:hypothetical protein
MVTVTVPLLVVEISDSKFTGKVDLSSSNSDYPVSLKDSLLEKGADLSGAKIHGQLLLTKIESHGELNLESTEVDHEILLDYAKLKMVKAARLKSRQLALVKTYVDGEHPSLSLIKVFKRTLSFSDPWTLRWREATLGQILRRRTLESPESASEEQ